jgi:hypothetical protein
MLRLYLLFPDEYARRADPQLALGSIQSDVGKLLRQEARVVGWQVWQGPLPRKLDPATTMAVIKSAAERGVDLLTSTMPIEDERDLGVGRAWTATIGDNVLYVLSEGTVRGDPSAGIADLDTEVGICVFSDKPLKKRRRFWRRGSG